MVWQVEHFTHEKSFNFLILLLLLLHFPLFSPPSPPLPPPPFFIAAIQQIAAVAAHINDYIGQLDNFKKMLAIQKSLAGSYVPAIVAPGRRFIKEGKLMKVG